MSFTASQAAITTSNGMLAPLRQSGDLYELVCQPAGGTVHHQTQTALVTAAEEAWLWHDKVGHRNQDDIKQLGKLDVGIP